MAEVLYRKYRPRTFADIVAQPHVVEILQAALTHGAHAHGYLFTGPRGTGKTSTARILAKALNCSSFASKGDVCNNCQACKEVDSGQYPDLIEIDAASNRGIDEIRLLKEQVNFMPVVGTHKVFIIDEVHMLTKEAFNALLKLLEEPPKHVVFILATTEIQKVPVTIMSRLQRYDFKLASEKDLLQKLSLIAAQEGVEFEPGVLELVFQFSQGSFRDAETLLTKLVSSAGKDGKVNLKETYSLLGAAEETVVIKIVDSLLSRTGDFVELETLLNDAQTAGVSLVYLAKQAATLLRDRVMHGKIEVTKDVVAVLSWLVGFQAEAKQVDDPRLLWDIGLIKVLSREGYPQKARIEEQAVQEISQKRNIGGGSAKKNTALEVVQPESISSEPKEASKWDELLSAARKLDIKLWTCLRAAKYHPQENVLEVAAGYIHDELNRPEVQTRLTKLFAPQPIPKLIPIKIDHPEDSSNAELVESIL